MTNMQCKKCQEKYPNKLHQGICKLCWSKIGKKSKRKGARNEREGGAKFYEKEFGITVRRTPRSGGFGSFMPGDIMAKGQTILNDFYIEMKNCEQWKLLEWYKKAREESLDLGLSKIPIIDVTRNLEEHFIFIRRDHFVKIMRELEGYRKSDPMRSTDRQN